MHAVIAHLQIKPGREHEAHAMVTERAPQMLARLPGAIAGYWARADDVGDVEHRCFWMFATEREAHRAAAALQERMRGAAEHPAVLTSVEVGEIIAEARYASGRSPADSTG